MQMTRRTAMRMFILAVAVLPLTGCSYNKFVSQEEAIKAQWAQVQNQLQRRNDLIPNLVETVKGYAAHERGTFEAVTQARANAISAQGVAQQAQAETQITGALKSLFAVSERYPDLKANQNYLALQEELTSTEGRIAYARQFYNETVRSYNTRIQSFPTNLLAGGFGFRAREYFEAEDTSRGPVAVQF